MAHLITTYSLKERLWFIAIVAFLSSSALLILLFTGIAAPMGDFKKINEVNQELTVLLELLEEVSQTSGNLLQMDLSQKEKEFEDSYKELTDQVRNMKMYYTDYDAYYQFQDIQNLVFSYGEKMQSAIHYLEMNETGAFSGDYARALEIKAYIEKDAQELMMHFYNDSAALRNAISHQLTILGIAAPMVIGILALMLVSMVTCFEEWVVAPIDRLGQVAKSISSGNYYEDKLEFGRNSEFNALSDVMYSMSEKIKENFQELENKAELVEILHRQEIENLEMKSMYNKLELQRLQEQINPHFLFNILSTLQHTAFLEGAEQTCNLANSVAKLLRYSLEETNVIVPLQSEWDNMLHYLNIQQYRFGERIEVKLKVPLQMPDLELPSLTLQPLVENCYNHGLENICEGGEIQIEISEKDSFVLIRITDNGCGMSDVMMEQYRELFIRGESSDVSLKRIGLWNVVNRLQRYFEKQDIVELSSNPGLSILLKLPVEEDL
ncbi:MAG: histidine kinase [Lachnospiraceae bacterium]|nr:histidine kinase [Lachnospiraceae bacterium]